jgi:solute carrier family 10 (sodium/bile acid cotransporter), member 7
VLATALPARGEIADAFGLAAKIAVGALFFLHGARLSREALVQGAGHLRLHLLVFGTTFVVFPLFGLVLRPLAPLLVPDALYDGILVLCALPATVQTAVVLTALAGGNVAAAVCSASASTLIGVAVTPVLVRVLVPGAAAAAAPLSGVRDVVLQLALPLVLGHLARRWILGWLERRARPLRVFDQGTIVFVVYVAFSAAVVQGLWHRVPPRAFAGLFLLVVILLAAVLTFTWQAGLRLGFARADRIAIVFGGSKKSLASGVAMTNVLFPPDAAGVLVVPLMMFHQLQILACATLARRWRDAGAGRVSGPMASRSASSARPARARSPRPRRPRSRPSRF